MYPNLLLFLINVLIELCIMIIKFTHYVIYCLINIIRIFRLTELYQPTFNPNNITFVRNKSYARESSERIEIIVVHIDLKTISTYLDIGSQLGYFVYKINELNHDILATGIEMNEISYMYSELLGILNKTKNVAFMNSELTSETAYNMPVANIS